MVFFFPFPAFIKAEIVEKSAKEKAETKKIVSEKTESFQQLCKMTTVWFCSQEEN